MTSYPKENAVKYSIVVPVYRSQSTLASLVERLDTFFENHPAAHEYIFVNDGSPDDSWQVLEQIKQGREDITIIDLMKNFGQHSAVFCGFQHVSGDFIITLDDDLQNPPEEILHLIHKADEGHDVIFGQFEQKMHGLTRQLGSKIIGWLNVRLFQKPPDIVLTNFRIIRREIIDAICEFRTSTPYIQGLVLMTAKSFANVKVEHHSRAEGRSNYTVKVIAKLVWRLVFNYSAFPLRALCAIGIVTAFVSFILGAYYFIRGMIVGTKTAGWPTLVVLISFYNGLMLILLGALGEYIVRIVNDVSGPRAYRIRRKL